MRIDRLPGATALCLAMGVCLIIGGCPEPPEDAASGIPQPSGTPDEPSRVKQSNIGEVVVLAAASLTEAFSAFEAYLEEQTGAEVGISFDGSQALRTSIEYGNAADVFASANVEHIEALREADLIEDAFEFAQNRVVLIVPHENSAGIERLADLGEKDVRLVIAVQDCPVGKYARELLAACDEHADFGPGFSGRVLGNVVSEDADVKQVLAKVILGAADAGFVYLSDLTPEAREQVAEIDIPEAVSQVATYGIGIPTTAKNPEGGRKFVERLLSEEGRRVVTDATPISFIESVTPPWIEK